MINMIRRFKEAWRIAGLSLLYSPEADAEYGWTEEDAAHWKTILKSPFGQKMKGKLNNYVMRTAYKAINALEDRDYKCGVARGAVITVAGIEGMANYQPKPEPVTKPNERRK